MPVFCAVISRTESLKPINPVVLFKNFATLFQSKVVFIFENEMFLINDGFNMGLYWKYQCFSKLLVFHFLFSHGDLVIFETIILPHWEVHVTGYRQSETPESLLGFPHQHMLGPLSACFTASLVRVLLKKMPHNCP